MYLTTALPSFYWFFVGKMRRPVEVAPRAGMDVALITLCVPDHESLDVIERQLQALVAVEYPHDSWVLDEGGSVAVEVLATSLGVRYFTRRGVERFNQPGPPFQAATKAGNVNAWLEHIGERGLDYEIFVQLDVDHRPRRDYLDRVLGYFRDPAVAWVQAPSVCGNLESWVARGLAEQDLVFQGPLQMGFYGHSRTPFIIGSHTTYRTSAVRSIGGFQPTRAEDHLDTVVLAARGYTGVFVPELIAVGDGPDDLGTYVRQQFAWAHSMIQVFLRYTPRLLSSYTRAQAFQFLMAQSWYTLWSGSLLTLWLMPALALFLNRPLAGVSMVDYVVYFLPIPLMSSLMWCWSRRWFQPAGVGLSWRSIVLEFARWPAVLWAFVNVVLGIRRPYMITPKGRPGQRGPSSGSMYGPCLGFAALSLAAIWTFHARVGHGGAEGYFGLTLANSVLGFIVIATMLTLDLRQCAANGVGLLRAIRGRVGVLTALFGLGAMLALAVISVWGPGAPVLG
jgi:cellulose synthase (UDP-forming)